VGVSAVLSYLSAQILFSVFIMDYMSRITERLVTGDVKQPEHASIFQQFIYLVKQEIPRTTIPVLLALLLMLLGWLTPLGPIISLISSALLIIFLSWDNTDLLPARRMQAFGVRFTYLRKTLLFHLSFGLLFLVPGLNILFLSFAPVGATLYYLEKQEEAGP
jgi:CysZ protein